MRATFCSALMICAFVTSAPAQQAAPSAVAVSTVMAERKPIDCSAGLSSAGSRPSTASQIVARVKGYLEEVLFKEGDTVKEGRAALPHRAGTVPGRGRAGPGRAGAQQGREGSHELQLQRAEEL